MFKDNPRKKQCLLLVPSRGPHSPSRASIGPFPLLPLLSHLLLLLPATRPTISETSRHRPTSALKHYLWFGSVASSVPVSVSNTSASSCSLLWIPICRTSHPKRFSTCCNQLVQLWTVHESILCYQEAKTECFLVGNRR